MKWLSKTSCFYSSPVDASLTLYMCSITYHGTFPPNSVVLLVIFSFFLVTSVNVVFQKMVVSHLAWGAQKVCLTLLARSPTGPTSPNWSLIVSVFGASALAILLFADGWSSLLGCLDQQLTKWAATSSSYEITLQQLVNFFFESCKNHIIAGL